MTSAGWKPAPEIALRYGLGYQRSYRAPARADPYPIRVAGALIFLSPLSE